MKLIKQKPVIIMGITASISAYKAIDIAKGLEKRGFELHIVLTKKAELFCPLEVLKTFFPKRVYQHSDYFTQEGEILHTCLAKMATYVLIAPASANTISDIATARGGNLLNDICLASKAPLVLAPAMNKNMWDNKLVQENLTKLKKYPEKYYIVGPAYGEQACGDVGYGRLDDQYNIEFFMEFLNTKKILNSFKITITLGRTEEKIDPARCITNFSTGKMGFAIAMQALKMGAEVTIIQGKTAHNLQMPSGYNYKLTVIDGRTVEQMYIATIETIEKFKPNIFIGTAAVSDYRPEVYSKDKIKKENRKSGLNIKLIKNKDIIATVANQYKNIFMVGFAAETNDLIKYAKRKLVEKKLDMVIANDISQDKAFGKNTNEVYVLSKSTDKVFHIPETSKSQLAGILLKEIERQYKLNAQTRDYTANVI